MSSALRASYVAVDKLLAERDRLREDLAKSKHEKEEVGRLLAEVETERDEAVRQTKSMQAELAELAEAETLMAQLLEQLKEANTKLQSSEANDFGAKNLLEAASNATAQASRTTLAERTNHPSGPRRTKRVPPGGPS